MRRTTLLSSLFSLLLLVAVMLTPTSASAITDGDLDGTDHPYVGLMVAQTEDGAPLWRCSGTLLSERVFLTAGHCTEAPAAHIEVFFDAGPIPLGDGYPAAGDNRCAGITGYPCTGDVSGTPYTHPQYDPNAFYTHDLGVVVLDSPVAMPEYGQLPALNVLDGLKPSRHTTFTTVGYGLQKSFPDAASWKDEATRVRMVAHPHLIQINKGFVSDFAIIMSANADTGGQCSGDSGGPSFIGDSTTLAGVVSFGKNTNCAGQGGVYRVDKADDLDWLNSEFGALLG